MKNDICVYFHINSDTKEVFYVGIGNIKRPYVKSNRSPFWINYTSKYKYEVNVVHTDLSWEEACEKEKEYIKQFGRRDLGLGTLVNLTDGGEGANGIKLSIETKRKMSEAKKGCSHSADTKRKMSISQKAVNNSDLISRRVKNNCKSVEMLDMEGRPLRRFDSIKEAGETSHINTSDITKVCKGKVLSAGKYKWRYC